LVRVKEKAEKLEKKKKSIKVGLISLIVNRDRNLKVLPERKK